MAGLLIMSLSMMPVGMVSGLQQLFTLICLFYIGSIIAEPARETLSASLADARARGSYMEFSRLGLAIGGAIGYIGGGWLFDLGCCRVLPNRHLMSFLLLPRANISSTRKRPARVILPTCWPTLTV